MGRRSGGRSRSQAVGGSVGKLTTALRWWLANVEAYRAAKEAAGEDGAIPEALEPPEIEEGFAGWYTDFWRLSTERQIGMGVGPIPQSEIDRHVAGWDWEDAEMFQHCIRELDGAYLAHVNNAEEAPPTEPSPMEAFRSATSGRRGK